MPANPRSGSKVWQGPDVTQYDLALQYGQPATRFVLLRRFFRGQLHWQQLTVASNASPFSLPSRFFK